MVVLEHSVTDTGLIASGGIRGWPRIVTKSVVWTDRLSKYPPAFLSATIVPNVILEYELSERCDTLCVPTSSVDASQSLDAYHSILVTLGTPETGTPETKSQLQGTPETVSVTLRLYLNSAGGGGAPLR